MPPRLLRSVYYIAIALILLGMLSTIQHWGGGRLLSIIGWCVLASYFILVIVEIVRSRKASQSTKLLWGLLLAIGPVALFLCNLLWSGILIMVLANLYLSVVRKQFLYTRQEVEESTFDIFKDEPPHT